MVELKEFNIYTGCYHIEGSCPERPELVATVLALDFKSACMKYELATVLQSINLQERQGYVNLLTYVWDYDPNKMSNSWTGKYYETYEEALQTFL